MKYVIQINVYGYSVLRNYRPRFSSNLLFQQHKSAKCPSSLNRKKKNYSYIKTIKSCAACLEHHQTRVRIFY